MKALGLPTWFVAAVVLGIIFVFQFGFEYVSGYSIYSQWYFYFGSVWDLIEAGVDVLRNRTDIPCPPSGC